MSLTTAVRARLGAVRPLLGGLEAAVSWWTLVRAGAVDARWYAARSGRRLPPPLAAADYVLRGRRRGWSPHPLVEPAFAYPDDWRTSAADPLARLLRARPTVPLDAHPWVDAAAWIARHPQAPAHRYGWFGHFLATVTPGTALPLPGWARTAPAVDVRTALALLRGEVPPDGGPVRARAEVRVTATGGWRPAWSTVRSALADDDVRAAVDAGALDPVQARVLRLLAALDDRVRLETDDGVDVVADVAPGVVLWPGWSAAAAALRPGVDAVALPVLDASGVLASAGWLPGEAGPEPFLAGHPPAYAERVAGAVGGPVVGAVVGAADPAVVLRRPGPPSGSGTVVLAAAAPAQLPTGATANPPGRVAPVDTAPLWRAAGFSGPGRREPGGPLRWSIATATPPDLVALRWGDHHFAHALAAALRRLGQHVAVDGRDAVGRATGRHDDVVLVLRGKLAVPDPGVPGQARLLWVISHPREVGAAEVATYDAAFAASRTWGAGLVDRRGGAVEPLLQATDPAVFHPDAPTSLPAEPVLFVGNSRSVYRPVVRALVEAADDLGVDVGVYGAAWERFLGAATTRHLRAPHVANAEVPGLYAHAGVVLNDHWPDMREQGFWSNRLFDAAACGARVVSDEVAGAQEVFGGLVRTYADEAGLVELVRQVPDGWPDDAARRAVAARIAAEHSFDARASRLLEVARAVLAGRAEEVGRNGATGRER